MRIRSKFKTLEEWLTDICDNIKPEKHIEEYKLSLSESSGKFTLELLGVNIYQENRITNVRTEFKPKNMYFRLPHKEYKNLDRKQAQERVSIQLKEFVLTDKFKASYLSEANAVVTTYNGEKIWTK